MNIINKLLSLFSADQPMNNDNMAQTANNKEEHPVNTDNKEEQETHHQNEKKENMETKARIFNLIIVDESGSMSHLREATLSGINETINSIRSAQEEFASTQEHTLTLVTFDSGRNRPYP